MDWLDGDISGTWGGKVATDSNNNVIVYGGSGAIEQHIVVKYDTDGNLLWQIPVDIDGLDYIEPVDLESYIEEPQMPIGYENYTNNITQMKISSGGNPHFHISSICTDENDNIILIGEIYYMEPPQPGYIVVFKYDQDGNEIWKNAYDYNDWLRIGLDSIVDSDGSIFIPCLHYLWSYVLKLNSDGSVDLVTPVNILPGWYTLSIALDSNENPVVVAIYFATDPSGSTMPIRLTKFNSNTGDKIADGVLEIPLRGVQFGDVALAVDTSDNSIFFGFIDYIYKIDALFNQIIWQKQYRCFINDLRVIDEKLVTCGGWCTVNGVTNYYSAVYNKDSGNKLLDMALGEILFSDDPYFQQYFNQLKGMSIDNDGDVLFAGGQGGIRTVKVRITNTGIPDTDIMQYLHDNMIYFW